MSLNSQLTCVNMFSKLCTRVASGVLTVEACVQVGKVSWGLQTSMPTLRANAHTFMFAIPGTQMFYSVLIAESKQSEL
jgi:hypothetical protein